MESQDIDMLAAGPHSYIAPAIPGPDSHPQATSSTTPSVNNPPLIPPLSLPTVTFQGQPRQRVVTPSFSRFWNSLCRQEDTHVRSWWRKLMPVCTPNQSPWSFSSMALLDTSVTDGETHWTMIDSALSSPITGGIGLEH